MIAPETRRWDGESLLVLLLAACISIVAFVICIERGYILLFGDAVAHINIARRLFDSRTPGLLQLGTVWLPLPHLLILPFIISTAAWHSGFSASIPCLIAYAFGTVGIFRLVRGALAVHSVPDRLARIAAWFAAAIYAANPNLVYTQATAMTEPLYMAFFIWAIVFFSEFVHQVRAEVSPAASKSLMKCGLMVAAAEFTRYDGWFLAAVIASIVIAGRFLRFRSWHFGASRVRVPIAKFLLIVSMAPALWFLYNGIVYRNPLEFANGPYSARAIEERTSVPGFPPHPGSHNLLRAGQYFIKCAELNLAEGNLQKFWVAAALLGTVLLVAVDPRLIALLLLWVPLPFYMLSIAYGSVPIFIPTWWPFSYYNVRYGMQLLPAAAVFVSLALYFLANLAHPIPSKIALGVIFFGVLAGSYYTVWKATPVCFREAWVNARTRMALEKQIASALRVLPPDSSILMYLGEHPGAPQDAAIPLRRTINEGDHRTWKRPIDPNGLWERALANPSSYADYVVAIQGDPVSRAVREHDSVEALAIINVSGQPRATIYQTKRP